MSNEKENEKECKENYFIFMSSSSSTHAILPSAHLATLKSFTLFFTACFIFEGRGSPDEYFSRKNRMSTFQLIVRLEFLLSIEFIKLQNTRKKERKRIASKD